VGIEGRDFNSDQYWENRYQIGGNSGAGSYGALCAYKAKHVNEFIRNKKIRTIIDFGCGDGNQLSYLDCETYLGLDVSSTILNQVREKFKNDDSKRFELYHGNTETAELGLSCEVLFHLIDDGVWEDYLLSLFSNSEKYIIIFAADYDEDVTHHVLARHFTMYIKEKFSEWKLIKHIPNTENLDTLSEFYFYERNSVSKI
jgi:SAM-dependent methyltransferase